VLDSAHSSADRASIGISSPAQRSRVTNGKRLLEGVDGRSAEAGRYRDLCFSYADDVGGAASLTEAQRALVRQAAMLTIQSEQFQAAMLRGEETNVEQQTRVTNSLARTLHRLGLKRASSKPGLSLLARLAQAAE
jgi:hypothetical protein